MTVNLSALAGAGQQFLDDSGNVLTGGKLYSYEAGTTTPQVTYTTAAGNVPHANPIILDAAGRVATGEIWVTAGQNYKFVLKTSTEVTLATWDNITGINGTGIATNAALVTYDPAGVGAVATTVQTKLREGVSIFDFLTSAQIADVKNNIGSIDLTSIIQSTLNYIATSTNKVIIFNSGTYRISSTITIPEYVTVLGSGFGTIFKCVNVIGPAIQFGQDGVMTSYVTLCGVQVSGNATTAISLNNCQNCSMEDVFASGSFTDGFYFAHTYPGTFKNLYTNGASITNSCFLFSDEVNACAFINLYTSNNTPLYNFYYSGTGHGNTFINPTAQGAVIGMYFRYTGYFGGISINGLYTENVAKPLVFGEEGNFSSPTPAFNITVNGATLGGPASTFHPGYSSTVASIELNSCEGIVLNGINFLSTYRTAGGFPTVVITGDGTGANALALVNPDGTINSVEVMTVGSGYTAATAIISGGGGTGAVLAVTVAAGGIAAIAVSNAGSGYKRTGTPMAIRYGFASNVKISGCKVDGVSGSINFPLYPFICRNTNYLASNQATLMIDDTSIRQGSIGCSAQVMKVGTNAAGSRFAVIENDLTGNRVVYVYSAPSFAM